MKNLFLLIALMTSVNTFSQNVEFAPSGATWTYERQTWSPPYPSDETTLELQYTGDIMVDTILAKKLVLREMGAIRSVWHLYQSGAKVYMKPEDSTQFYQLFDFNMMPGDSFLTTGANTDPFMLPGGTINLVVHCLDRDTMSFNGLELPVLTIFVEQDNGNGWLEEQVTPKFGALFQKFLFYSHDCCYTDQDPWFLCSYSDNEIGEWKPLPVSYCEITHVSTLEPGNSAYPTLAIPNPFVSDVQFDLSHWPSSMSLQIQIKDIAGRAVQSITVSGGKMVSFQLPDLKPGLYFYQISNKESALVSGKLVKIVR